MVANKQVLNKDYTFIISELLNNCYDNTITDYSQPTCLSIKPKLTKKVACFIPKIKQEQKNIILELLYILDQKTN